MSQFVPDANALREVIEVFRDPLPGENPSLQYDNLQKLSAHPDFLQYLPYVMRYMPEQPQEVRGRATLHLKNMIKNVWTKLPPALQEYVKVCALETLTTDSLFLRNSVGTLIATISEQEQALVTWPDLIPHLLRMLDSQQEQHMDSSLQCLYKIAEDAPIQLNTLPSRPLNEIIPRLIQLFLHRHEPFRVYALTIVNFFLEVHTVDERHPDYNINALIVNMPAYMENLFKVAGDESKLVRRQVCQAFVSLLESHIGRLIPKMSDVIQFMLMCTADPDSEVALKACEFWPSYCTNQISDKSLLSAVLKDLIPLLLRCLIYTDEDVVTLGGEEDVDDHAVPDNVQDIRPQHHFSKKQEYGSRDEDAADDEDGEDDEIDEEDEDEATDWTLRKCAASTLDTLANTYQNEILPTLLPALNVLLAARGDTPEKDTSKWRLRESGILALGAVAEGCYHSIVPYLNVLVPYLLQLTDDNKPLVRSITCWTLSRYATWMVHQQDQTHLSNMISKMLTRLLDKNKRVQEAACSAFAALEEVAQNRLVPYLSSILSTLMTAFSSYQAKNLLILYDAIGTLAEAVGPILGQNQYISVLLPPLINKWNSLEDDSRDIFPLLECLTSVAQSLGLGFAQYAKPVLRRCLNIIESNLLAFKQYNMFVSQGRYDVEMPDKEFVVCALDLLSGLAEGLDANMEGLVAEVDKQLLPILFECIQHPEAEVRQSAFAFLGDIAKSCMGHLRPHLDKFLPVCTANLDFQNSSVCNNSSWAVGEIAIKVSADELMPYIPSLMERLSLILKTEGILSGLQENAAITVGRLGYLCPMQVSPMLPSVINPWLVVLARLKASSTEKLHAFRGLCQCISLKPDAIFATPDGFGLMCYTFTSWENPSREVYDMCRNILASFKQVLGARWPEALRACDEKSRDIIVKFYQL